MGILDKIRCPVCGGMGAQLETPKLASSDPAVNLSNTTIACKHCDAELDDRPEGDLTKTYIREALKEKKGARGRTDIETSYYNYDERRN